MGASDQNSGIMFTGCEFTASVSAGASAERGGGGGRARHAHAHDIAALGGRDRRQAHQDRRCARALHRPRRGEDHQSPARSAGSACGPMSAPGWRRWTAPGVDVEALSINPFWYRAERDAADRADPRCRTSSSSSSAPAIPTASSRFATAALQYPDLAAAAGRARRQEISASAASASPAASPARTSPNPKFHPFWAKCEEHGRARVHAPARHARIGAERQARRQRPVDQHDRQPARNDDRAVAPDLRGHARPLPGPQDLRRAWRRLPAVLRQPLGRGHDDVPGPGRDRSRRRSRPNTSRRPALFRLDHVHRRGACAT